MAVLAALSCGRYTLLRDALRAANLEVPSMDEFIRFGIDQGMAKGLEKGLEKGREVIARLLERKLARALRTEEREALVLRLREEPADALVDHVLDRTPAELAVWLSVK